MRTLLLALALQDGIDWKTDYEAALAEAKKSGRYLHVHVWGPDCPACEAMEARTLSKGGIATFSNAGFVNVKLGKETHAALCRTFGVDAVPATILVSPEGEKVGFWEGYLGPEDYRKTLEGGVKAHGRLKELEPKRKAAPDDPALLAQEAECRAQLGDARASADGFRRAAAKTVDPKARAALLVKAFEQWDMLPGEDRLNADLLSLADELDALESKDEAAFARARVEIKREHWDEALKKFEAVAATWPKSDRAPAALLTAADLYHHVKADHQSALAKCLAVMDGWPGSEWAEHAKRAFDHIKAHSGEK